MAKKNEQNAQNEQAQTSPEEKKDALVCLDKTTNNYGVVTSMDEQTGQMDWEGVGKDHKPSKNMLGIPNSTWLGKFMDKFVEQYGHPSQIGFSIFRVPIEAVGSVLDAIVKVRIENGNDREATKMLERYELNDQGRIAKLARTYKYEERELPLKALAEWGVTPEIMREYKCMGDFMKGRVTDTPIPIRKQVNGEWKEMGKACFCTTGAYGKTELMVLPVLKKEQFNTAPFDKLFSDDEKQRLATEGHLGTTKVMKDFVTGRECECFVSYHEPTKRLTTLPVDAIKIPNQIYGKPITVDDQTILKAGGRIEVSDIQRRNGPVISGTAYVDANRRDVYFTTGGDRTLKVGKTINGAPISEEQARLLEARQTVFVRNMRDPKTGRTYSDDVRFSESNILLVGNAARNYSGQRNGQPRQNRKPRRGVSAIPAPRKAGQKQNMG